MANVDIETRKRRGRPRSGQSPGVSLRLDPELQDAIDRWRAGTADNLSRSEKTMGGTVFRLEFNPLFKSRFTLIKPASPLEPYQRYQRAQSDNREAKRVTPGPIQLGHELEVHAIDPGHYRRGYSHDGNNRQHFK
jgi:hypothetical protein